MWSFDLSKLFNILAGKIIKIIFFVFKYKINFQNQNNSKPPTLCPFCRSEIKGFESIIINPFDNSTKQKEFDDINKQINTIQSINNENSLSDIIPPPIPPRPINLKLNSNIFKRFEQTLPPPLHNNSILILPQQTSASNQRPISSLFSIDQFRTIDDIRNRLITENTSDQTRIEAVLILTQGLALSKQYEMSKLFLNQVKYEQNQL